MGADKFAALPPAQKDAVRNAFPIEERKMAAMLVKRDASNLSETLAPLLGDDVARYVFGLGVLGMAINAVLMNMLICGLCFAEIFGKGASAKWNLCGSMLIALSAVASVFFKGAKMWLVIHAGVIAMVLLPIAYGAFLVIMNSKKILGSEAPRGGKRALWNALMCCSVAASSVASLYVLWNKLGYAGPAIFVGFLSAGRGLQQIHEKILKIMENPFDIKNRVIAVTGATGVLAGETARYLAKCGAKVAFIGRDPEKLAAAEKFCKDNKCEGAAIRADVTNKSDLISARDEILGKWGALDCLVNGAGGNRAGATIPPDKTFFDLDLSAWEDVFKLNMEGTLLPTLVFGEIFRKTGKGSIVNFSSMTAQQAVTRVLGYSNAKAAIDNLTKWLAVDLQKKIGDGVRVNAVAPGFFLSEQNRTLLTNEDGSLTSRGKDIVKATPFARFGRSDEVCGAVHYLCSDASSFVTGTVMAIDGGFSCFSGV